MTTISASPPSHIPVLLQPLLEAVSPVSGLWLDGTFGAGGYARGLLDAGADQVIGVDRDPLAFEMAADWAADYGDRLRLVEGTFGKLDTYSDVLLDGVVLDLGVSSMQLDRADRGFSFLKDGPLDMRMAQTGQSAADLVNSASVAELADIIFQYGEERASRKIATAIVAARQVSKFETTLQLAAVVEDCLPRKNPAHSHPATRTFQAIRIAVNNEFGELLAGLQAAERALKPGGKLAVVTFHSLEDRVVKRYFSARSGGAGNANRYAPQAVEEKPQFRLIKRGSTSADKAELAQNTRARSARLRVAHRTEHASGKMPHSGLGMPKLSLGEFLDA
ncbi:MAG TPA: 16S rRNA (cytosine(1402)-N(4))-methyltransferase [Rhodobacteraceae bacterium]|jgi:16S rRNA (cytosine1402-N4)-methyltransferase|nr:16S rRNA (cytosine(1402)-N(4))-methyltransferase [Paracoccaceae bacterium]